MKNKEICWNITARCNQQCKYCHRFLNINELSYEENKKILNELIKSDIKEITWTGGEALLLDYVDNLIKVAFDNGISNKLITNGKLLTEKRMKTILPYLDSLTLSIDSISPETNEKLGRGYNHFNNINKILTYIEENKMNIKLRINTVINKINLNDISELTSYLNNFSIFSWRIFKFMPLRETAVVKQKMFEITDEEFKKQIDYIFSNSNIDNIDFRVKEDMETKYILILADGSIVLTDSEGDKKIGNALYGVSKIL